MTGSLPWGWLNTSAPVIPGTEHQHDDVTLRPDERLRLGSIVAGWDEQVPCNTTKVECTEPAEWAYRCTCGRQLTHCTAHRLAADNPPPWHYYACGVCWRDLPTPIPWLPL